MIIKKGNERKIMSEKNILKIDNLSFSYGTQKVLNSISFDLQQGMQASLLGPSGCGKSTLLNVVAGFHEVDGGEVWIEDRVASSALTHIPPEQRNTGMIFQDYALFPHLNIIDNVTFGLQSMPKRAAKTEGIKWLNLVRMGEFESRFPHELSGGQQQRVALARALAAKPKLLLMDEPFSNLDADLRRALVREVSEILRDTNTTAILVTHDQEEAFIFGDHIGLMRDGKMEQWGKPAEIYAKPVNRWVADFVGGGSWLKGVNAGGSVSTSVGSFKLDSGCEKSQDGNDGCHFEVLLRPHEIDLIRCESASQLDGWNGGEVCRVVHREFTGQETRYVVEVSGSEKVDVTTDGLPTFETGEEVKLALKRSNPIAFEVAA
jgi:iron(III) transport system ATP-binding protein